MVNINPFSHFSDPYISPDQYVIDPSSVNPSENPTSIVYTTEIPLTPSHSLSPFIASNAHELPDETIIVFRGSPTGFCAGPNIKIPVLNIDVSNGKANSQVFVSCTSTYPESQPYNPIADRYEVRLFRDGWILTLADGCGLQLASRLAPKAAMEGFWEFLTDKLKNDQDGFKTQKLAHYLYEAIQAGHFNIYWDAYLRNQAGYSARKQEIIENLKSIQGNPNQIEASEYEKQQSKVSSDLNRILDALKGDRACQRYLMEQDLNKGFFQNYAGATTFLCSALIKGGAQSEAPYYLLSVSLGDCKGYLFRDGKIKEVTKDTREDISNARDPGGKIGLCTPVPLKIDTRNLQYSLTPCLSKDILFFMTDGVIDNLDPERIGLHPNARNSPQEVLQKIRDASDLEESDFEELLDLLNLEATSWRQVSLEQGNEIKTHFANKLLEKIIQSAQTPQLANEKISSYCHYITSEHRDEKPHYQNLFGKSALPIGKPDHTTVMTIQVP